jgi:pimeloyl-ACP methyl ester carboxylesterase
MRPLRRMVWIATAVSLLYVLFSYLLSRLVARRLLAPEGLGPTPRRHAELESALAAAGAVVAEMRHAGSPRLPCELSAVFATPGDPARRSTLLFLHGKGGNASEWEPDALRALAGGYNVLLPDLRGHGRSGGELFTLGFLEREDLDCAFGAAAARFGIDGERIGIHSCSAGCSVALEFAADRPGVRAIWLESPFAEPRRMARRYLAAGTGIPEPVLALASRWAIGRSVEQVRRAIGAPRGPYTLLDPIRAIERVRAPVALVHGAEDRLVPPAFTRALAAALPPGSEVWDVAGAGHCHHENEPEKVRREEYEARWREFFVRNLPARRSD